MISSVCSQILYNQEDKALMKLYTYCLRYDGGKKKYGGITDLDELKENSRQHCIPDDVFNGLANDYNAFLEERRKLMAAKIRKYFNKLSFIKCLPTHYEQQD